MLRVMLASDWDENKITFPKMAQPKVDGVRGTVYQGNLVGRSLKSFANNHTVEYFSHPMLEGLDGELYCGYETDPDLCRKTTSALNTIEGKPLVVWKVFDLWTLKKESYATRYLELAGRVDWLNQNSVYSGRIELMPTRMVNSLAELEQYEGFCIEQGYEGVILRDPNGSYKHGRSTIKEAGLLRVKRTTTSEAIVVSVNEGQANNNEAQVNELGYISRTTHMKNMVPNGMVGSLTCKDCLSGAIITVSAGKLNHEERIYYFNNQEQIIGKLITYKHFPHGKKDKPRQPTFQNFRMEVDL